MNPYSPKMVPGQKIRINWSRLSEIKQNQTRFWAPSSLHAFTGIHTHIHSHSLTHTLFLFLIFMSFYIRFLEKTGENSHRWEALQVHNVLLEKKPSKCDRIFSKLVFKIHQRTHRGESDNHWKDHNRSLTSAQSVLWASTFKVSWKYRGEHTRRMRSPSSV